MVVQRKLWPISKCLVFCLVAATTDNRVVSAILSRVSIAFFLLGFYQGLWSLRLLSLSTGLLVLRPQEGPRRVGTWTADLGRAGAHGPLDLGRFADTVPRWRCEQEPVDWKSPQRFHEQSLDMIREWASQHDRGESEGSPYACASTDEGLWAADSPAS